MPDAGGLTPPAPGAAPPITATLPRAVARRAAQWLVRLHAGQATPAQRDALARWRAADPLHELAWQRAERLHAALDGLPPALGLQVLDRPRRGPSRRTAARTLAVLVAAAPAGYLAWTGTRPPSAAWTAAHRTATGERRSIVLPDGTRLELNTATAVDVAFHDGERDGSPAGGPDRSTERKAGLRLVVLHHGEVFVETAPDRRQRPFMVETRDGRVLALGTRFMVRRLAQDRSTLVAVQHSAVQLRPGGTDRHAALVGAGLQARFDGSRVHPVTAADLPLSAWTRGLLFASAQRLADFAAELGRYRPGRLHCAPDVAELRISGVFRLDDTDAILAALPDTLPVRVVWRTRWWVGISAAATG
jgi:transmembrane sensor